MIWLVQLGNVLTLFSWIPQIFKILMTKEVRGFNIWGYIPLLVGMLLLSYHAYMLDDIIFVLHTLLNSILCAIQIMLIYYFRRKSR